MNYKVQVRPDATEVTFTCERCGQEVTRQQTSPGFLPRYCDDCAKIVKREKTRERVAKHRAAKKTSPEGS